MRPARALHEAHARPGLRLALAADAATAARPTSSCSSRRSSASALLIAVFPPSAFERSLIRLLASLPDWLDPSGTILYDTPRAARRSRSSSLALAGRRPAVLAPGASRRSRSPPRSRSCSARLAVGPLARARRPPPAAGRRVDVSRSSAWRSRRRSSSPSSPTSSARSSGVVRWMLRARPPRRDPRRGGGAERDGRRAARLARRGDDRPARLRHVGRAPGDRRRRSRRSASSGSRSSASSRPTGSRPASSSRAGLDARGEPLLVKVYGRDAYDTQLLEKVWRTALYADDGPRLRRSRIEAVEHEALVTLLARAGRRADARRARRGGVVDGRRRARRPTTPSRPLVARGGRRDDRRRAPRRGVAGGRRARSAPASRITGSSPDALAVFGGEVGLVDFDRATIAARPEHLLVDRAQLHATLAALVGHRPGGRAPRPRALGPGRARRAPPLPPARRLRPRARPGAARGGDRRGRPARQDSRGGGRRGADARQAPPRHLGQRPAGRAARARRLGGHRRSQRPRLRRPRVRRPGRVVGVDRWPASSSRRRRVSRRRCRRSGRSPPASRSSRCTRCSSRPAT